MKDIPEAWSSDSSTSRRMGAMHTPCPFSRWGIDLVGPFPMATGQRKFLIVAIDYFNKWVEDIPLAKMEENSVIRFLCRNICCRFGVPKILMSDNGTQFNGVTVQPWCEEMGITQRFTSVAHPQANGQLEVTNRTIVNGIRIQLEKSRGRWVDELDVVLWAYRTTMREAIGESPFHLVYGAAAVIPAEVGIKSHRLMHFDEERNEAVMQENLDMLEEE